MSKIFDSLRQAELAVAEHKHSDTPLTNSIGKPDRRRTCRARVQVPLLVYGYNTRGTPFYEEACTVEINAHGALIALQTVVSPGDRLILINATNERTQECTVLAATDWQSRDVEVAVAFATPAPQFWRKLS